MKPPAHYHVTPETRLRVDRARQERRVLAYAGRHYRSRLLDRRQSAWHLLGFWLMIVVTIGFILGAAAELFGPSSAEAASEPGLVHVINHVAYLTDTERYAPLLVAIATCESRMDPLARGRDGSEGLFQMQPVTWTWASARAGFQGASPFEPVAATYTAAWLISHPQEGGGPGHWRSCLPQFWGV